VAKVQTKGEKNLLGSSCQRWSCEMLPMATWKVTMADHPRLPAVDWEVVHRGCESDRLCRFTTHVIDATWLRQADCLLWSENHSLSCLYLG
jgi:hypothetical protein